MRAVIIPTLVALGLGLAGTSAVLAGPASDDAIALCGMLVIGTSNSKPHHKTISR